MSQGSYSRIPFHLRIIFLSRSVSLLSSHPPVSPQSFAFFPLTPMKRAMPTSFLIHPTTTHMSLPEMLYGYATWSDVVLSHSSKAGVSMLVLPLESMASRISSSFSFAISSGILVARNERVPSLNFYCCSEPGMLR